MVAIKLDTRQTVKVGQAFLDGEQMVSRRDHRPGLIRANERRERRAAIERPIGCEKRGRRRPVSGIGGKGVAGDKVVDRQSIFDGGQTRVDRQGHKTFSSESDRLAVDCMGIVVTVDSRVQAARGEETWRGG